jgi:hypothetical protein
MKSMKVSLMGFGTLRILYIDYLFQVLFQAAWDVFATSITDEARSPRSESTALGPTFLEIFDNFFQEGTVPKSHTRSLIRDISLSSLLQCEAVFNLDDPDESTIVTGAVPLINILRTFGESLFKDHDFAVVSQSSSSRFHI